MPEPGLTNYRLVRSGRKTLSLQINKDAELIVRAPNRLSVKKIEQFIDEKSAWIIQKQQKIKKQHPTVRYQNGEKFLYLGKYYPLKIIKQSHPQLDFDGCYFYLCEKGKTQFKHWYKMQFKKIALPRLAFYSDQSQLSYNQVRVKSQKTLWGSCSPANNINLNYLLIQSPIEVIDYVIVHELCHIRHKNHSKDFWNLVESILPNYKKNRQWLKENGYKLHNL